ncbi:Zinc finger protein [Armadillidium vulgare]|nr:Zinc finger protein [Armadillidium vulgare]
MSHSIFDGLSVISLEGTGLTVQQLLDSSLIQNAVAIDDQSVTSSNSTIEHLNSDYASISVIDEGVNFDEDDLFQCGRCKLQFTSLEPFMIHKRNQCPILKVKKYINEVTISASSPSSRDCATPSSPSALNQVSSSTVSQNDLPQVENQDEVDQSDKFDCSLASALTSTVSDNTSESVVVSGGDFFSLTLDNTQEAQSALTSDAVVSSVVKNDETLMNGTDIEGIKVEYDDDLSCDMKQSSKYPRSILPQHEVFGKGSVYNDLLKDRRKHTCMFCNKTFSKNFDLRQHIRSHTGEKPFQCIVCGRAFAQKSNVKKHMITHKFWPKDALCNTLPKEPIKKVVSVASSGENADDSANMKEEILFDNSYVCPFCSSTHSTYLDLRSHMKEHKDQKTCCKDLKSEHSLKVHQLIHTGERPFECDICKGAFNRKDKLKRHMLVHEPKKFKCPFGATLGCQKEYSRKDKLRLHLVTHAHSNTLKLANKKGETLNCESNSSLTKDLQTSRNNQGSEVNTLSAQVSGSLKNDEQTDLASKLLDRKKADDIEVSLQPVGNILQQGISSPCNPTGSARSTAGIGSPVHNASSLPTLGSPVPNASSLPTLASPVPAKIRVRKHRRVLSNKNEHGITEKAISTNKEPITAKDVEDSSSISSIVEGTCTPTTYSAIDQIIDKDLFKDSTGITADVTEPTNVISILDPSESQSIEGESIESDGTFIASLTEEVVENLTGNNKLEVLYIPFALTTQSDFDGPKTPEVDDMVATSPNNGVSIVDDGSGRSFFVSTEEFESLENLSAEILLSEQDIHVVQTHDNPHIDSSSGCVSNVQSIRNNIFVVKGLVDRDEMDVTLEETRTIILHNKDD